MGGCLESCCVGRVCGADGAVRMVPCDEDYSHTFRGSTVGNQAAYPEIHFPTPEERFTPI